MRCRGAVCFLIRICLVAAALAASAAASGEERRIEGRVLRATVTLCQLRPRGCAGYFDLEVKRPGGRDVVLVHVRLGVPIRHGDDYVLLGTLPGSVVSVVHVVERGAIVARWIEVRDIAGP